MIRLFKNKRCHIKSIVLLIFVFLLGISHSFSLVYEPLSETWLSSSINNFHVVEPGIYRGSQPSEEAFKNLKQHYNVITILCLRSGQEHNEWERKIVEELGMRFINIAMKGSEKQSKEKLEKCLDIIRKKSNQPIFVHCQAGKDRTGLVFAAYRIKYHRWSLQDALTEMLAYGYDRACCSAMEESLIDWNRSR